MIRLAWQMSGWVLLQQAPSDNCALRGEQAYIRPRASGKEMLLVSRIVVFCFGMFTGVICIILNVVRTFMPVLCLCFALCMGVVWAIGCHLTDAAKVHAATHLLTLVFLSVCIQAAAHFH